MILFIYSYIIISYRIGWEKLSKIDRVNYDLHVSVIISVRNESANIKELISCLKQQEYPVDKWELIIVNDHSTDSTLELLENESKSWSTLHVINQMKGFEGKKQAISLGVRKAKGSIIISTDADCRFCNEWIGRMASYFRDSNVKLVSGPVCFSDSNSFFSKLQSLEFTSLIASAAGAIGISKSIFCNGANLAYRKKIFDQINISSNYDIASGDDVFLLHKIKEKYPDGIYFAKDKKVIVQTMNEKNWYSFVNQRKRWTAKSISYTDKDTIFTSIIVLLTNSIFLLLFVLGILAKVSLIYFLVFLFVKFLVDILLLYPVAKFLSKEALLRWIFPFELFYALYIVCIVVISFTTSFRWKERIHKR